MKTQEKIKLFMQYPIPVIMKGLQQQERKKFIIFICK